MSKINRVLHERILKYIRESFYVSASRIRRIIKDFHSEMERGLAGKGGSLKMIPVYVDRPAGEEKGRFIALDVGGTNLRILGLELRGKGKVLPLGERSFVFENKVTKGSQREFFDFIARCIAKFARENKICGRQRCNMGFTFSFPIKQTGIASGVLLRWTKDFSVKGVKGREVVGLLRKSLARAGLKNIKIVALVNDTVGTLISASYADPECDTGVILGTGTNACYREEVSNIGKLKQASLRKGHMIINIEWGNFNKLKRNPYDKELDGLSANPGEQFLEKMVSGMYLGEIVRLVIKDLAERKILFEGKDFAAIKRQGVFQTQYLSRIESDSSGALSQAEKILKELGIGNSALEERALIRDICKAVSERGAWISAAALAAVITKIDSRLSHRHTVAIDGTLYEKHPGYARIIKSAINEIFGAKAHNIGLALTKDGSGKGAAIAAAVVVSRYGYA